MRAWERMGMGRMGMACIGCAPRLVLPLWVMRFAFRFSLFSALSLSSFACGGAAAPKSVSVREAVDQPPLKLHGTTASARAARAAAAVDAKSADPEESPVAIRLTPLFTKHKPPKFPKPTVSDLGCWQGMELSGNAAKDFAALVARCGTPTGVAEYVHPAKGYLHHAHDQRDSFKIPLEEGYCYRYFAVADATIDDLDILVTRHGGDVVGNDQSKGQVAIIQSDKPWCMDDDVEYEFEIGVDGRGQAQGNYLLGVWARPKDEK
jgi:hypothetical protein